MTSDDLFARLLQRFDCAFQQTLKRGHIPSMSNWNLILHPAREVFSIAQEAQLTNPFSLVLEGTKIMKQIYGEQKGAYKPYLKAQYPYFQLERTFLLPINTLATGFYQGITEEYFSTSYRNLLKSNPEYMMAFDCGRYVMSKYFNYSTVFTTWPFMKNPSITHG